MIKFILLENIKQKSLYTLKSESMKLSRGSGLLDRNQFKTRPAVLVALFQKSVGTKLTLWQVLMKAYYTLSE